MCGAWSFFGTSGRPVTGEAGLVAPDPITGWLLSVTTSMPDILIAIFDIHLILRVYNILFIVYLTNSLILLSSVGISILITSSR